MTTPTDDEMPNLDTTTGTHRLTPNHEATLELSGISEDEAHEWGIYSALTAGDLPTDIADYKHATPGIVFPLRENDGTVSHQIRLDKPGTGPKYLQAPASTRPGKPGSIITVPAMMADRVGKASTLLLVEGTKQTISAALHAPDDVLVIGIQGCTGYSDDGAIHQDFIDLANTVDHIKVAFDADVSSNPDVWTAAERLQAAVQAQTKASSCEFILLKNAGFSGKIGLDDAIGRTAKDTRRDFVKKLLDMATPKIGRKPAAPKKVGQAGETEMVCDLANGRIGIRTITPNDDGTSTEQFQTVMSAAFQVTGIESMIRAPGAKIVPPTYTLTGYVKDADGIVREYPDLRVSQSELEDINPLVNSLPPTVEITVTRPTTTAQRGACVNAIRATTREVTEVRIQNGMGWGYVEATNSWGYFTPGNTYTTEGLIEHYHAHVASGDLSSIQLVDLEDQSVTTQRAKMRDFILMRDTFSDATLWDAALAAVGLAFLPISPQAAIGYFGPPSSGKSTIAQGITAMLDPRWAPKESPQSTFNTTVNAAESLLGGLRNVFVHVDDFKPEADKHKQAEVGRALDMLLRRSHGSGSKKRARWNSQTSSVETVETDDAAPIVIITGEQVPSDDIVPDSALDRMLVFSMEPKKTFKRSQEDPNGDKALERFRSAARYGAFQPALAVYVKYLTEQINEIGGDVMTKLTRSKDYYEQVRSEVSDVVKMQKSLQFASTRATMIVASLVLGLEQLLTAATAIGAISQDEQDRIIADATAGISKQMASYTTIVMNSNEDSATRMLNTIRGMVASKKATVDPADASNARLIGKPFQRKTDDVEYMAINPEAVAELLNVPKKTVTGPLAAVAIRLNGDLTYPVTYPTVKNHRSIILPMDVWLGGADDDEDLGGRGTETF